MTSHDFTTTISVAQSPDAAFAAVTNVRGWWSGDIEGETDKLGDEFTYRYRDVHYSQQRITELVPGEKVAWTILDSRLDFTEDPHEWTGTQVTFDITRQGGRTEVRFAHLGLVPEFECFDACSSAWRSYVNGSLERLIRTGSGEPNPPAGTTGPEGA